MESDATSTGNKCSIAFGRNYRKEKDLHASISIQDFKILIVAVVRLFFFPHSLKIPTHATLKQHPRMDRSQTMPNMRKPYENTYTKTYEGSTWRGAQDGNMNAERYGPKPANPRFQANGQYNGHVQPNEAVPNGTDATGKPVRQPRPNTYQNRQNGTYVPRTHFNNNNTNSNNTIGTGGAPHQGGPPYGVNPNANGYQGNRGKPEASVSILTIFCFFFFFF